MHTRRIFALLLAPLVPLSICAQSVFTKPNPKTKKKFYITGLAHTAKANDCTIPPIVTYGTDRINALLYCCESGALTVWTEEEYLEFRRKAGAQFDKGCEQIKKGKDK